MHTRFTVLEILKLVQIQQLLIRSIMTSRDVKCQPSSFAVISWFFMTSEKDFLLKISAETVKIC